MGGGGRRRCGAVVRGIVEWRRHGQEQCGKGRGARGERRREGKSEQKWNRSEKKEISPNISNRSEHMEIGQNKNRSE
jgi:hypothetical protein